MANLVRGNHTQNVPDHVEEASSLSRDIVTIQNQHMEGMFALGVLPDPYLAILINVQVKISLSILKA